MSTSNHDHDHTSARLSWQRASKFRENLSVISIAPKTLSIEKSQFSPDSPPPPPPPFKHSSTSPMPYVTRASPAHLEAGTIPTHGGVGARIKSMLFRVRAWGAKAPEMGIPIQQPPHLGPWPALQIEKKTCPCQDPRRKRRRRWLIVLLIVVLLFLLANSVVLNIRVLAMQPAQTRTPPPSSATPTTPSTATELSADAQQCVSQFTLNAPSSPSSYPCSSCLPVLQAVPTAFSDNNPQDGQNIQNAIQFCGLKSIFDSSDSNGQAALVGGNWVKDIKFCLWSGVTCGGSGLISSIQLTFPAVPTSIPDAIGSLTGLQTFQIIGNNVAPAGALPSSFSNLTALSTLHLESTALTALPDTLFTSLKNVKSLTLVKNTEFGGGVPSTVGQLSLQTLVINGQTLSTTLNSLLSSPSLQASLQFIDLSSTGLSTSIPSFIPSIVSLSELHLDNNNLQPPLPTFPSSMQVLSLVNNTALSGAIPGSLCSSTALKTCNLRQTGLGAGGACGACQF